MIVEYNDSFVGSKYPETDQTDSLRNRDAQGA